MNDFRRQVAGIVIDASNCPGGFQGGRQAILDRARRLRQHQRDDRRGNGRYEGWDDAGCGDGLTIATLAQEFGCDLVGRDFAPSMINLARVRLAAQPSLRADLAVGDVCRVVEEFGAESFDFITTDRCLVNMASESQQYAALAAISAALKPGGFYLGIENFIEGNERLNAMRALFGLPPIAIRWHNNFFRESEFVERARHSFRSVEKHEFSSAYYFATRVVYSKVCAVEGVEPDYRHAVHAESGKLPTFGDFSPTKLFVLGK